jgi:hypothetical protein
MKEAPHSSDPRLHRLSDAPATFFVTKSLQPKKPILDQSARDIIISAFAFAVQEQRIHLRAFVVMPDPAVETSSSLPIRGLGFTINKKSGH